MAKRRTVLSGLASAGLLGLVGVGSTGAMGDQNGETAIEIIGVGEGTRYQLSVTGSLSEGSTRGSLSSRDSISGDTATGSVSGGIDPYTYTGSIAYFEADGPVRIGFPGADSDPDSGNDDEETVREVTVRGNGTYSEYTLETDEGEFVERGGTLNRGDSISSDGKVASGNVTAGEDRYFLRGGEIVRSSVFNDAELLVDGEQQIGVVPN